MLDKDSISTVELLKELISMIENEEVAVAQRHYQEIAPGLHTIGMTIIHKIDVEA